MPTPKLFTRQFKAKDGTVYLFYRYWDDHNNNYEYQVYKLVEAKDATRNLGADEIGNTRKMSDWVWDNVKSIDEK